MAHLPLEELGRDEIGVLVAKMKIVKLFRELGSKRLPELGIKVRTIEVNPKLVEALKNIVSAKPDDKSAFEAVAVAFGFTNEKRGVAEYIGKYIALMAAIKVNQRTGDQIREQELTIQLINIELDGLAKDLGCPVDELAPTLRAVSRFVPAIAQKSESVIKRLEDLELNKSLLELGKFLIEDGVASLEAMAGNLSYMEKRIPDKSEKFVGRIALAIWKRIGGATTSDFDAAREKADEFLRGSMGNPKIAELVSA